MAAFVPAAAAATPALASPHPWQVGWGALGLGLVALALGYVLGRIGRRRAAAPQELSQATAQGLKLALESWLARQADPESSKERVPANGAAFEALWDAAPLALCLCTRQAGGGWVLLRANPAAHRMLRWPAAAHHLSWAQLIDALPEGLRAAASRLQEGPAVQAQGHHLQLLSWDEGERACRLLVLQVQADAQEALAQEQAAFGYTASHDLRAPIRVVEGFTRILKEDYGHLLDRVGNDHLDRVLAAGARMNSMIDALLALGRLSTQPLSRQPVNLSQVAGFILDDLKRQHPERTVQCQVQPDLVAMGDPTLLRLLLENLLGNAWKYTARCNDARLSLKARTHDGRTVYEVHDNGAGFDMRNAERLFGVFQRLHAANEFPGTGVGLASVKRIVLRHGGQIWAESEPGQGACFSFTLGA